VVVDDLIKNFYADERELLNKRNLNDFYNFVNVRLKAKSSASNIPGQGPEGHLVLKLENEVVPPLQIQKTTLILTKIGVFD